MKCSLRYRVRKLLMGYALVSFSFLYSEEALFKVNFQEIRASEFAQFLSEVAKVNFIYDESEMDFSLTMVSDEETSVEGLLSAFVQALRIRGFQISEQEDLLLIHKNGQVKELPYVVGAGEDLLALDPVPALVTKVYQIKNSPLEVIQGLVKPFLSVGATIESFAERKLLIVSDVPANILSIDRFIQLLDRPFTGLETRLYRAKGDDPYLLVKLAKELLPRLTGETQFDLVVQEHSNKIFILGSPSFIERTIELFEEIDEKSILVQDHDLDLSNLCLYRPQFKSIQAVQSLLKLIVSKSSSEDYDVSQLTRVVNRGTEVGGEFLLYIGTPQILTKVKALLQLIDAPESSLGKFERVSFLVYEPTGISATHLLELIKTGEVKRQIGLASSAIELALNEGEILPFTNAILFTAEASQLGELKTLLDSMVLAMETTSADYYPSQFFIYKIEEANPADLLHAIQELVQSLVQSNSVEKNLIQTLKRVQLLQVSNALLFVGSQESNRQIKEMLKLLDQGKTLFDGKNYLIYSPKTNPADLLESIQDVGSMLHSSIAEASFTQILQQAQWLSSSQVLLLIGDVEDLSRAQELLVLLDQPHEESTVSPFSIYRLSYVSGKFVMEELEALAQELQANPSTQEVAVAISKIRWNRASNTLILQGTPSMIEQLRALIVKFDSPLDNPNHSFIYRPRYLSPENLQKSLTIIGNDLENSGLAEPGLVQTIRDTKVIPQSKSIIILGTEVNIIKVKEIIASLDQSSALPPPAISSIGQESKLTYQPHQLSAAQLLQKIKEAFEKSKNSELKQAVESGRIVDKELEFKGPRAALVEIGQTLELLDTSLMSYSKQPPEDYQNYKPIHRKASTLVQEIQAYMSHLQEKGVKNGALFETIEELSVVNGRIVIVGSKANIDYVLTLLAEFDVAGNEVQSEETQIETFDQMSFLNYRLNFHRGDEIQEALQKIGQELAIANQNESLVQTIRSVQWVQVTNSLIATGDSSTLLKLKEILKSIDVPVKQVFIEVLVIETETTSDLDFGVRWGAFGHLKNRVALGAGNAPLSDSNLNPPLHFLDTVKSVTSTNPPSTSSLRTFNAGTLGVLGDIIFHKGRSFLSLGSLLSAIQMEGTATIVLNQKILAQDNRPSKIFVGENIPYTGSIVTTSTNILTTNANLEYRNIGVSLEVTPNIGEDTVTLLIDQDITEESSGSDQENAVNNVNISGIRTSKALIQTKVHVPDRCFVVLSGQIRNSINRSKQGIPCLGALPWIGGAFAQSIENGSKKNLIVFIRPEIIHTSEILRDISEEQQQLYKNQGDPKSFEAALDLVVKDEE